jgi:hypothetical protein
VSVGDGYDSDAASSVKKYLTEISMHFELYACNPCNAARSSLRIKNCTWLKRDEASTSRGDSRILRNLNRILRLMNGRQT